MADMLATPTDLSALPGMPVVAEISALAVLEAATAVVQNAAGQILVAVTDDAVELLGTVESWFTLPQRPVTAITSVELDGEEVTDFRRHGARLWRRDGWQQVLYEPSTVAVTYGHGYPVGHRDLQLAKAVTLMLAKQVFDNPAGLESERIGDYARAFATAEQLLAENDTIRTSLRRKYGVAAGLVRLGGS